jgi:hypothetical protein
MALRAAKPGLVRVISASPVTALEHVAPAPEPVRPAYNLLRCANGWRSQD